MGQGRGNPPYGHLVMPTCPGACGLVIARERMCCVACWARVPMELKTPWWRAQRSHGPAAGLDMLRARAEILRWLNANPAPARKPQKVPKK